ncbi:MAG: hypothetical protein CVT64_05885 [Actinobacteria bacterium HGW-Actinobacteria-4]|nr:MAG: hypothetical protein CVT64_05885 [Actinobacteria bacterium HGW-Actinobacteria-4]
MTFNESSRLDPSRVQRRGKGGGVAAGGGLVGMLLVLLFVLFGGEPGDAELLNPPGPGSDDSAHGDFDDRCATGADANAYADCRVVGAMNSLDAFWAAELPTVGTELALPGIVIFDQATTSACGQASAATGPFYCPADQSIYVDVAFWDVLSTQFGASGGPLAEMYVIAHEYGHHLQNQLGVFGVADRGDTGADSDSVKVELMADCLAGVWAGHASTVPDATGQPFLAPLTEADIQDALSAAGAVGDDRIQEARQGETNPHTYTHGTSAERQAWFMEGYTNGDVVACDQFGVL